MASPALSTHVIHAEFAGGGSLCVVCREESDIVIDMVMECITPAPSTFSLFKPRPSRIHHMAYIYMPVII